MNAGTESAGISSPPAIFLLGAEVSGVSELRFLLLAVLLDLVRVLVPVPWLGGDLAVPIWSSRCVSMLSRQKNVSLSPPGGLFIYRTDKQMYKHTNLYTDLITGTGL